MSISLSPASLYPVTAGVSPVRAGASPAFSGPGGAVNGAATAVGSRSAGILQPLSSQLQALLVQLQVGSQAPGSSSADPTAAANRGPAHHHLGDWQGVPQGPGLATTAATTATDPSAAG